MVFYKYSGEVDSQNRVVLLKGVEQIPDELLSQKEEAYVSRSRELEKRTIHLNRLDHWVILVFTDDKKVGEQYFESVRIDGYDLQVFLNQHKVKEAVVEDHTHDEIALFSFLEGIGLGNYQFLKYFSKPAGKQNSLEKIGVRSMGQKSIKELNTILDAVCLARDLVNEPVSYLTAPKFAEVVARLCRKVGVHTEILDKARIEALKMGGLLAVNRGSIDPPRFMILSWEPEKALNKSPLILIGKGIVYDTGGLSLKPTPNSMDEMKSDMAGAATVVGTLYALARINIPVRVIGLIPATDNRPDGNAYTPGDVIHMHDGTSVEVLNTDAEGRLILADALSYAKKFQPELVIDMATLTGSTQMALGSQAAAVMSTASEETTTRLIRSGAEVYERLVQFPLWDEYGKLLESELADLKNIGGRMAGAITAGKFLQHFTEYPWMHLDIAGTAFLTTRENYRGIGGTGTGVRMLIRFIKHQYKIK